MGLMRGQKALLEVFRIMAVEFYIYYIIYLIN